LHFAKRCLLWSFTIFNMALWKRPENALARCIFLIAATDKQSQLAGCIDDKSAGTDLIDALGVWGL
jgi:hypothetical protein